jgi:hypothetical protein
MADPSTHRIVMSPATSQICICTSSIRRCLSKPSRPAGQLQCNERSRIKRPTPPTKVPWPQTTNRVASPVGASSAGPSSTNSNLETPPKPVRTFFPKQIRPSGTKNARDTNVVTTANLRSSFARIVDWHCVISPMAGSNRRGHRGLLDAGG